MSKERSGIQIDGVTIHGTPAQTIRMFNAAVRAIAEIETGVAGRRVLLPIPGIADDGRETMTSILLNRRSCVSFIIVDGEDGSDDALRQLKFVSESIFADTTQLADPNNG